MPSFRGFPRDFFRFGDELVRTAIRAWFPANKPRFYDPAVSPMGECMIAIARRRARQPGLVDRVAAGFRAAGRFNRFITHTLERPS